MKKKSKIAEHKFVGWSYRYLLRARSNSARLEAPELSSIHLQNTSTGDFIALSDGTSPIFFKKCLSLLAKHFDLSTSLKADLILALNEITFIIDSTRIEYPIISIEVVARDPSLITEADWKWIMQLTELDASGATRSPNEKI